MNRLAIQFISSGILFCLLSCASGKNRVITDFVRAPEEVHIFSIPVNSLSREMNDNQPSITKGFPFIAAQPGLSHKWKFSPEFYTGAVRAFRSESLQEVDFWGLKKDPHLYDVIYVKPLLFGEFKTRGNGLMESIAYSYNIPAEQLSILDDWIRSGGILWIESGIFISIYDYEFNKFNDKKLENLVSTLKGMTLYDHKLHILLLRAQKTDDIHIKRISQEIVAGASETIGEIKEVNEKIRSLLLEQYDYIGIYFSVDATPIIKSGDKVYASYMESGKGKIITLPPFDFSSTYHDGELFRLTLLSWALGDK